MKAKVTFFLNNIITQHLISATKAWFHMSHHIAFNFRCIKKVNILFNNFIILLST